MPFDSTLAFQAGELALSAGDVPIADSIIGGLAVQLKACVVSDDRHFEGLGIKTVWYR